MAVLGIGGALITKDTNVTVNSPVSVESPAGQFYGNASSPSLIDGCLDFGNSLYCQYSQGMKNASTTCSFRSPTASSTLVFASAQVRNAFGGTFAVEFGKSSSVMATTTSLGYITSVTGGTTIIASSTSNNGGESLSQNFTSAQYLNIKVGSSSPTIAGNCVAAFLTL